MSEPIDPLAFSALVRQLQASCPWLSEDVLTILVLRLIRQTGALPDDWEVKEYIEPIAEQHSDGELRRILAAEGRRERARAAASAGDVPATSDEMRRGQRTSIVADDPADSYIVEVLAPAAAPWPPDGRQSLDGQEPGDPSTVDLLARAVGRRPREGIERPTLAAPARPRRARGLADPRAAFERALVDALNLGESRLSKTAIATRMEVDRKTLGKYIEDGLIPRPPWESLAKDLSGTPRPQ